MMQRFLNLIGIGRATLVDDSGDLQVMQVTEGAIGGGMTDRITDKVQRVSEFGFSSVPPIDSEVLVIRRNGERALSIVIGTSHRPSRPRDLKAGDTVIYDERGRKISLTEDGIEIDGAGGPVTVINATKVRCECTIETTGDVVANVDGASVSLTKLAKAYNAHVHPPLVLGQQWGSGPPNLKA